MNHRGTNKALCTRVASVTVFCVLPNGMFFQEPLDRDGELPQEALDDWPALGELVLHLDLQDVGRQRHETKPLGERQKTGEKTKMRGNSRLRLSVTVLG